MEIPTIQDFKRLEAKIDELNKANNIKLPFLTPDKLEELTGITKDTQKRLRTNREIPFSKIGHSVVYKLDEIEDWIDSQKIA